MEVALAALGRQGIFLPLGHAPLVRDRSCRAVFTFRKEPASTQRASLGKVKAGTHLQRARMPAAPVLEGSQECPKTFHSSLHTTQGALGSGRSPCSSYKISALDIALQQGSAPWGSGHS